MYLPFFPLKSVFFPGEGVPLHIFEPRYRDLIRDCREEAITFGIPVFINNRISYGTEVQLVEVVTTYEGGEMDVLCVARQAFRVRTFDALMEGKPYAGGEVEFLDNVNDGSLPDIQEVLEKLEILYELMGVSFTRIPPGQFSSFTLAHKMGLSFEQEHLLLQIPRESERLKFIKAHLNGTIQILKEVNRTKELLELNGHFRNYDPLDFKDYKA